MKLAATIDDIRASTSVLGRAALFDDRITPGDEARIAAWAEALAPHDLTAPQLLQAVTTYYSTPRDRSISVGELISLAKAQRRDSAEREGLPALGARQDRNDRRHGLTGPDAALGGLPIGGADGPPVPGAYEVNGAVDRVCPFCGAPVMSPCVNPVSGMPRRIPCSARLRALR